MAGGERVVDGGAYLGIDALAPGAPRGRRPHVGIGADAPMRPSDCAQATRTGGSLSVSASTSARAVPASRAPPSASAAATRASGSLDLPSCTSASRRRPS